VLSWGTTPLVCSSFPPRFSYVYSISVSGSADSNIDITRVSTFECHNESATTDFAVPVDGSILFVIDQLQSPESLSAKTFPVDLSSIPTLRFPTGNVLAFLLCSHVSIQTRQVRATGNGNLTLGKLQPSPGNINFHQANYLLSYILLGFPTDSGPTSTSYQVGTDLMVRLIFGTQAIDTPPPCLLLLSPTSPLCTNRLFIRQ
jgi:hypothetical protein